jgi:hypothetical protein
MRPTGRGPMTTRVRNTTEIGQITAEATRLTAFTETGTDAPVSWVTRAASECHTAGYTEESPPVPPAMLPRFKVEALPVSSTKRTAFR